MVAIVGFVVAHILLVVAAVVVLVGVAAGAPIRLDDAVGNVRQNFVVEFQRRY